MSKRAEYTGRTSVEGAPEPSDGGELKAHKLFEGDSSDVTERISKLVGACHRRMGSPLSRADLEEVIQETALVAWKRRDQFRGESEVETWLYGIARICILRQLGRRRRAQHAPMPAAGLEPIDPGTRPGSRFDTGMQEILSQCLERSGATAAAIVRAHGAEGLTFEEVGARLHMTEPAVKARYYRALPKVRERLRQIWGDVSR